MKKITVALALALSLTGNSFAFENCKHLFLRVQYPYIMNNLVTPTLQDGGKTIEPQKGIIVTQDADTPKVAARDWEFAEEKDVQDKQKRGIEAKFSYSWFDNRGIPRTCKIHVKQEYCGVLMAGYNLTTASGNCFVASNSKLPSLLPDSAGETVVILGSIAA